MKKGEFVNGEWSTSDYLIRNGIVIERAKRACRSLSATERSIILAGRGMAKNLTRNVINMFEMQGERQFEDVLKSVKVVVRFAHYNEPYEEIPATASYFVMESNHPSLPTGGNVGADQLTEAGIKIPKTPVWKPS